MNLLGALKTAACLLAAAAPLAHADVPSPSPLAHQTALGPERPLAHFAKGSWSLHGAAGYFNDLGPFDVEAGLGTVGLNHYFADDMSLGVELLGYAVSQPGPEAVAGGAGLVFRHHVLRRDDVSCFIDVTGSVFEADEQVPRGGTRFNFITQFGVGLTRRVQGNTHLLLGVRYLHLSNAGIEGDDRNPSLNGVAAYVGVLIAL